MARAKTKSSKKWLLYLIAAVILIVAGFVLYHKHATAANKKNFQDARATIDNIYYDAIKQIGPADNAQISSSCSRSHVEFSKGELSCDINTNFIYGVSDESESNDLMHKVQSTISTFSDFKPSKSLSLSIKDSLVVDSIYHIATDSYTSHGLKCTVNYIYDTPRETDLRLKSSNQKPFEVTIGCSGPAKQQYYRLAS